MAEGGSVRSATRAFDALSFEEEKHELLGLAHRALAAKCRCEWAFDVHRNEVVYCRARRTFLQHLEVLDKSLHSEASDEILNDREVMPLAMRVEASQLFRYFSREYRGDLEVVLKAVKSSPAVWAHVTDDLFVDPAATLMAVEANPEVVEFANRELFYDKSFVLEAVTLSPNAFRLACDTLKADREVVIAAVTNSSQDICSRPALEEASAELRNDKSVVLAALSATSRAFQFASDNLRADREVLLAALRKAPLTPTELLCDGPVLRTASLELRNDKDVVLAAVAQKPWAYQCASEPLRNDREVLLAALRSQNEETRDWWGENVIGYANAVFQADKELVLEAVRSQGSAMTFADLNLRSDKDFVLQASRVAPPEECCACFRKADPSLHETMSLEDFLAASKSALAVAGETCPVVTVALGCTTAWQHGDSNPFLPSVTSCEVMLLSGTSFTCNLVASPNASESSHSISPPEPAQTSSRLVPSTSSQSEAQVPLHVETPSRAQSSAGVSAPVLPALTLNDLANVLVAELPKHVQQADAWSKRVFVVFANGGDGSNDVQATPWEWNRPLSEFVKTVRPN